MRTFTKGKSTYTCSDCGKLTRETGESESECGLCLACFLKSGDENMVADGHMTPEAFEAKYGERCCYDTRPL